MAHHDWQSLVELYGLMVSEPVLNDNFPTGPRPLNPRIGRNFRLEFERWQGAVSKSSTEPTTQYHAHQRWLNFILSHVLGYRDGAVRRGQQLPPQVRIELHDYLQTLQPNLALVDDHGAIQLLLMVVEGKLDRPETQSGRWKASPFTKMDRLLRETQIPLGILTNGEDWRLVYAAPGLTTAYITWTATGWKDETQTLNAFAMLLSDPALLLSMATESQQRQADVTDQLGVQVLGALSLFVRALDEADTASDGQILHNMSEQATYEMALFLMMRLVFMFYAEENNLLPHGEVFYDEAYGLTYLWNHLDRAHLNDPEHFLQQEDAWWGLLASFRMIHRGATHPDLNMVAYGGALFAPERFPILEHRDLKITNAQLWAILQRLITVQTKDGRQRVSYRALQVEQLGYVYENLLGYTVRVASVPMMIPLGGLEAYPLDSFSRALDADLYAIIKDKTKLSWSRLKQLCTAVVERHQQNPQQIYWVLEPIADSFIQEGQRYVAFQMGTRKRGGIFYTPPQLTSFLVEQALKPQVYDHPDSDTPRIRTPQHLLGLTVCDPAMGSGAFLVQAVRYLGDRLVEAWDAIEAAASDDTPRVLPYAEPEPLARENYGILPTDSGERQALARRLIAERCIYGVDLNGLAVELAKLSLWLVTLSKSKPFTFLDHRLRHGNSLIGASFFKEIPFEWSKVDTDNKNLRRKLEFQVKQIAFIPDDALQPPKSLSREAKKPYAARLKGQQKALASLAIGQLGLFGDLNINDALAHLIQQKATLSQPTTDAEDYLSKERLFQQVLSKGNYPHLKEIADLWCAVWFWERNTPTNDKKHVPNFPPTTQEYHDTVLTVLGRVTVDLFNQNNLSTPSNRIDEIRATAHKIAQREAFFAWELEFPDVFVRPNPGFDALVGNPPWEVVKPNSQEFFEQFDPDFRKHDKQHAIRVMDRLRQQDPTIDQAWTRYIEGEENSASYFNSPVAYQYQGRGDVNTYKLFTERFTNILAANGYMGLIIPSGIYTDLGTKELRELLFNRMRLDALYCYENRDLIFQIDSRFKFVLLFAQAGAITQQFRAAFMRHHISDLPTIRETALLLQPETVRRFSPDSLSIMEFKSQRDVDVAEKIYSNHPLLGEEVAGKWNIKFTTEFHMTNDSHLFNTVGDGLPLYEGKMIWHFDAFFSEPHYWVNTASQDQSFKDWLSSYRFAYREVASGTNQRTAIGAIIPLNTGAGHTLWTGKSEKIINLLFLMSVFNSFCIDHIIRYRVSTHLVLFQVQQLPIPRLMVGNPYFDGLVIRAARLMCTHSAFAELWAEVVSPKSNLTKDRLGEYDWQNPLICPPPRSENPSVIALRQRLRDEVDALVAHLYGLTPHEFAHVLDSFPLVFPTTEAGAEKKSRLLAVYAEFSDEVSTWARS